MPKRAKQVWEKASRVVPLFAILCAGHLSAQTPQEQQPPATSPPAASAPEAGSSSAGPIAIVTVNGPDASANPTVTGALEISGGKAMIVASRDFSQGSI